MNQDRVAAGKKEHYTGHLQCFCTAESEAGSDADKAYGSQNLRICEQFSSQGL